MHLHLRIRCKRLLSLKLKSHIINYQRTGKTVYGIACNQTDCLTRFNVILNNKNAIGLLVDRNYAESKDDKYTKKIKVIDLIAGKDFVRKDLYIAMYFYLAIKIIRNSMGHSSRIEADDRDVLQKTVAKLRQYNYDSALNIDDENLISYYSIKSIIKSAVAFNRQLDMELIDNDTWNRLIGI